MRKQYTKETSILLTKSSINEKSERQENKDRFGWRDRILVWMMWGVETVIERSEALYQVLLVSRVPAVGKSGLPGSDLSSAHEEQRLCLYTAHLENWAFLETEGKY